MKKVRYNKRELERNTVFTDNKVYDVIRLIKVFEGEYVDKFVIISDHGEEVSISLTNSFFKDVTSEYRSGIINDILN